MENSIYVGLSRQIALRSQMDVISNNIANMNTPGYRAQNMVFTEFIERTGGENNTLSMVLDYGQYQDTSPGPMRQTGNPLDIGLQGPGYIGIETPEGIMYTRAGSFQINSLGELITGSGHKVAGSSGLIIIPSDAGAINFAEDGTISSEEGEIGQVMIVEFENVQSLEAIGNGLYKTDETGTPATNTRIIQGMIEGSNVNAVKEMTRMIDTLRAFQATQQMLQSEHDRQRTMIRRLTQGQ